VSHIWGFGNDGDSCLIKAHIRHLRQKVEPDPANPRYIVTVPGVGYTMIRSSPDEQDTRELVRTLQVAAGQ
jgi:DNA-binding response OmpR family regulator